MKEEKRSKRVFFLLCCCFLAFVIGGANYITGLLSPVILLALLLLCIPAHEKRGLGGILPLLIMLIGFFINVRAPGNAVRIAAQLDSMGPVEAVYYSFVYAVKGIGEWTNLYVIFFAVLLAPFLFRALSGCRFSFPASRNRPWFFLLSGGGLLYAVPVFHGTHIHLWPLLKCHAYAVLPAVLSEPGLLHRMALYPVFRRLPLILRFFRFEEKLSWPASPLPSLRL